jgi:glycosyltransferase involved in cell wall biosynthesis
MRILIAIPVYNEQRYVADVLRRVREIHDEILVVDDGSTDATPAELSQFPGLNVIRHPENRGYGQSVIDAFAWADARGFDWVVTMDCDEQHEPARIPDFIREIATDQWDIVSGSRYLRPDADDDHPPGDRRQINHAITTLLNALFNWSLTDAFCGFKAHRVSAMSRLRLDEPGYAFPLQLWPRAYREQLRIHEIPVKLIYNDPTRHFGGLLDDATRRLTHYIGVLHRELTLAEVAGTVPTACCGQR